MTQFRNIWLLTLLACVTTSTYSQQDSRAAKYLQTVSDQFDLNKGYVIEMDYIREDLMHETSVEGEGLIWMKGLKYKIIVDEYIVYYNGDKLYSQNTENEEVYVSAPNPDEEVDINGFTYPGPKPSSKENAVLMMADSVEAASRTLKVYTSETISDLVENIVSRQAEEGQFSEADITFADITAIKEIFKNRLSNIYHSRIEYPE